MKTLVIKVGGEFLTAQAQALKLFAAAKQLQAHYRVVFVHGGGPIVEKLYQQLGFATRKLNGLRITPDEEMGLVCGALAGTANKQLVSLAIKAGGNPVGICLADGLSTRSEAICAELGAVGNTSGYSATLLETLLDKAFLPIVSSIGADEHGRLLNVNADDAATAIAKMLQAELLLLSNVPGVLDADKQLLPKLTQTEIDTLAENGVIRDGMLVKVNAALEAANDIGQTVTIAGWQQPECLLNFLTSQPFGTQIVPTKE